MLKEKTRSYYENLISEVISYILQNPGSELNIKNLSEMFNISYYHFHRIMRSALDEPLGNYINKVRLSKSAQMIKETDASISEIAEKIGYNNLSSFSKSFLKEYGISPNEFRFGNECVLNSEIDFQFQHQQLINHKSTPKIKILPPCKIIFANTVGEYGGLEAYNIWDSLFNFAVKARVITWHPDFFSIYYDDPDLVGIENCNYDCCMTIRKTVETEGRFKIKQFDGGKFLVFRYKGPYDNLGDVYNMLYHDFIILFNKYHLRDAPIVEKYVRYSEKTTPENYITDICIPID